MKQWIVEPCRRVHGSPRIPGDKSISHRAVMLAALAEGTSRIRGFLNGNDCRDTISAMRAMGVAIDELSPTELLVHGVGMHGLRAPQAPLDLGNSGTAMRLLCGLLAGQHFDSTLCGDASLQQRPMRRVTDPLNRMGALIETAANGTAPLRIHGGRSLRGLDETLPIASAQLKSALLFAGLYAEGTTYLREPGISRDHSERMLRSFGYPVEQSEGSVRLNGGGKLIACDIDVPADISSAAFFIVAALIAQEAELNLNAIGVNPTRSAVIDILQTMQGKIERHDLNSDSCTEPLANLRIRASRLRGIDIDPRLVPIAIDEFPIIFIAAACAEGVTRLRGAAELRVKESDRLATMEEGLRALGVSCQSYADGIDIEGGRIHGGRVKAYGDHRIAMSFAIAALAAEAPIIIEDTANVATSFPNFIDLAKEIGLNICELDA